MAHQSPKNTDRHPLYASSEAGAHWCGTPLPSQPKSPSSSPSTGSNEVTYQRAMILKRMEEVSYVTLMKLCDQAQAQEFERVTSSRPASQRDNDTRTGSPSQKANPIGVMRVPSRCVYTQKPNDWHEPWYASLVENFQILQPGHPDLPPTASFGFQYTTVAITPQKYLAWLMQQFMMRGGVVKHQFIVHIDQLMNMAHQGQPPIVINCTGLGARYLGGVGDLDVFPVRGQTVLCRPISSSNTTAEPKLWHGSITRLDGGAHQVSDTGMETAYIIPHEDGTILLGGTFEVWNQNIIPHPHVADGIMKRCLAMNDNPVQEGELRVLRHGVGLRPFRVSGPRVEAELRQRNGKRMLVIHQYGHGSYGFQSSWGSADKALEVLERALETYFPPDTKGRI